MLPRKRAFFGLALRYTDLEQWCLDSLRRLRKTRNLASRILKRVSLLSSRLLWKRTLPTGMWLLLSARYRTP